MTIDVIMGANMLDDQEFSVYDLGTGKVVWVGVLDDCPYRDEELLSWDIDSNGALYMNIELEGEWE